MSLKDTTTTTTYLDWNELTSLIFKLETKQEYRMCLYVTLATFSGLRIGDILKLKWIDIIEPSRYASISTQKDMQGYNPLYQAYQVVDNITIREEKTNKVRYIKLAADCKPILQRVYKSLNIQELHRLIFENKFKNGKAIDRSIINDEIKRIFVDYKVKYKGNISSHLFRKTFGKRIFDLHSQSDLALVKLSILFGHSSPSITRTYLGITKGDIDNLYDSLSL